MGTHLESLKSNLQRLTMQLFIKGTETHNIEVEDSNQLVNFICEAEQAQPEQLVLSLQGKPLEFSDLEDGMTIDVAGKLLGGKVHGSLARAGKVKGQTPKVEPQEKRKPKTGRAKKRLQYNKRFVVASQSFGRKKGPNSQQV